MRRWFVDIALTIALGVVALLLGLNLSAATMPVQAAPPAPPEVKECQPVNTAKVSDTFTILVFRCQPDGGVPYLLNTAGFMKDEE